MRANPYSLELNYRFQDRRGLADQISYFDTKLKVNVQMTATLLSFSSIKITILVAISQLCICVNKYLVKKCRYVVFICLYKGSR
jgi:hypothetical protein